MKGVRKRYFLERMFSASEYKTTDIDEKTSVDLAPARTEDLSGPAHPVPVPLPPTPSSWRDSRHCASPINHALHVAADSISVDAGRDGINCLLHHPSRPTKRNPNSWTPIEDQRLIEAVMQNGTKNWAYVGTTMQYLSRGECNRTGKQCRERWHNHLDPTLSHAPFSAEEDAKLIRLQEIFDNKWTEISKRMPGRSDNAVKNRWNSCLSKVDTPAHTSGRKRSAQPLADSNHVVSPRLPFKDSWRGNVEWGKTPLGNVQHSSTTALPCAVRSVRRSPPDSAVKTESSGVVPAIVTVTDLCFADKCSIVAQYGFRAASGHVRRTRCMLHHEAGMYVCFECVTARFIYIHFTGCLI